LRTAAVQNNANGHIALIFKQGRLAIRRNFLNKLPLRYFGFVIVPR